MKTIEFACFLCAAVGASAACQGTTGEAETRTVARPSTASLEHQTMPTEDEEQAALDAHRQMVRAMLDQRLGTLDALLADGFTLTHMTGYRQPKREWLQAIRSGEMRYHGGTEVSVVARRSGDAWVVVGRDVVDATIYGARGRWNLQLTTRLQQHNGHWLAVETVATTF